MKPKKNHPWRKMRIMPRDRFERDYVSYKEDMVEREMRRNKTKHTITYQ
jgi:hypothetical protein